MSEPKDCLVAAAKRMHDVRERLENFLVLARDRPEELADLADGARQLRGPMLAVLAVLDDIDNEAAKRRAQ